MKLWFLLIWPLLLVLRLFLVWDFRVPWDRWASLCGCRGRMLQFHAARSPSWPASHRIGADLNCRLPRIRRPPAYHFELKRRRRAYGVSRGTKGRPSPSARACTLNLSEPWQTWWQASIEARTPSSGPRGASPDRPPSPWFFGSGAQSHQVSERWDLVERCKSFLRISIFLRCCQLATHYCFANESLRYTPGKLVWTELV